MRSGEVDRTSLNSLFLETLGYILLSRRNLQHIGAKLQNLEFFPVTGIIGKTKASPGVEAEMGIIERLSQQNNKIVTPGTAEFQPGTNQPGADAGALARWPDGDWPEAQPAADYCEAARRSLGSTGYDR